MFKKIFLVLFFSLILFFYFYQTKTEEIKTTYKIDIQKKEIEKEENKIIEKEKKVIEKKIKLKPLKNQIYFSAFPDFGGEEDQVSAEKILVFEKLAGKKIFWATFSQNFYKGLKFPKKEIAEIRKTGAVPLVRFLPHPFVYNDYTPNYFKTYSKMPAEINLEKIIAGDFDKDLRVWAREAKKDGKMILFDFAVEPNGDWFFWSGKWNGGGVKNKYGDSNWPDGPERWRDAYRHIIDIFRQEGVKNLTYFFHFNLESEPNEEWNQPRFYYPGDEYIDWVGFSFYGPQNPKEDYWDKFSVIFQKRAEEIVKITDKKSWAVMEFGVTDHHPLGKKSEWLKDAFTIIKKNDFIKFSAINYWHENWEEEDDLWATIRIDSSQESLKTFQKEIADPIFFGEKKGKEDKGEAEEQFIKSVSEEKKEKEISEQKKDKDTIRIYQPKLGVGWHWQLDSKSKSDLKVELYDIDLFDNSSEFIKKLQQKGHKVVCYFSAGSFEGWRDDAKDFIKKDIGKKMDGWDEKWLDIRSKKVWEIMRKRIQSAASKGCDGVEPDNVDGFDNETGFDLTFEDQLKFNHFLAETAHKNNLSIALKNDLEQIKVLVNDFDFALNEECFQYDECEKLLPFIKKNKAVLNVEYKRGKKFRAKVCSQSKKWKFSTLFLPEDLDGSFAFSCN